MFATMDSVDQWVRMKPCRLCGAPAGEMCSYPNGRPVPRVHGIRQLEAGVGVRDGDVAGYEAAINRAWRGRRRERNQETYSRKGTRR